MDATAAYDVYLSESAARVHVWCMYVVHACGACVWCMCVVHVCGACVVRVVGVVRVLFLV